MKARHAVKILSLSMLAAVCMMAISASAAQAGEFRINGGTFTSKGVSRALIAGLFGLGLLNVPTLASFHCTSGHIFAGHLVLGGVIEVLLGLFLGCTVEGNANCTVVEKESELGSPGTGKERIAVSGTGKLVLSGGSHYATAESTEFATIYLSGAKCTLPEEAAVSGSVAIKLPKALSEEVNQEIADPSKAEEEALGVQLFYGANKAFIENFTPGTVALEAPNLGLKFGAE